MWLDLGAIPPNLNAMESSHQLTMAEDASAKYGWLLHVIEDAADDPPLEQPEAFLGALHVALEKGGTVERGSGTRWSTPATT